MPEVIFTLGPIQGATGEARFDNNTTEIRRGNGNHTLRIKGILESSAVDTMALNAASSTSHIIDEKFTVAVITSLEFERINTGDIAIDNNPGTDGVHTPDEGRRIFPDKNIAATTEPDRSIVRVKAVISPAVPNARVYFASFDLDDPSATMAPIDSNLEVGDDNNGAVNGSRSGEFANPASGTCMPPATANHISRIDCTTSGNMASANYKITMQPGDNFAIAASLNGDYRTQFRLDPNAGARIINTANQIIPIFGASNVAGIQGVRTDMLTVWRRLHIEVDSMGAASQNRAVGTIAATTQIAVGQTVVVPLNPTSPFALEVNRFEGGRLVSNSRSLPVICDLTMGDTCNTTNSVTVRNTGTESITLAANTPFQLYDDDDFNNSEGANLDGDEGDDIGVPDTALLTAGSDDTATNVFAAAYVRPVYDIADSRDDCLFQANTASGDAGDLRPLYTPCWDSSGTNADPEFWSILILGAYQHTTDNDHDPSTEGLTWGIVDEITGVTGDREGSGALIFMELHRDRETPGYNPAPTSLDSMAVTVAHEVGHLFSCIHGNGGLMGTDPAFGAPVSNQLSPTMIFRVRGLTHP